MNFSVMSYTLSRQNWKRDGAFDLARMCELAAELGLDGVDMMTTYGRPPLEVRRALADHGLKPVCYTFPVSALNAPSAAARAAGVDAVARELDAAAALGAPIAMLVTPGRRDTPRDVSRRQYLRGLQECAALARRLGITLTLENFPGADSPFAISSDMLEAVREVPGLKLTFDNGNTLIGGEDPAASFRRSAAHVAFAHFKDWAPSPDGKGLEGLDGRRYRPALIGEGVVDQKACLAAMKEAGYAGYINIEYEGNDYPPDDATRKAVRTLQNLLRTLP